MRYKAEVIKRFPNAIPVVINRWPDGSARYIRIMSSVSRIARALDVNTPNATQYRQLHAAAWRSAYYCMYRLGLLKD